MARKSDNPEVLELAKRIASIKDDGEREAALKAVPEADRAALKEKVASERAHSKRILIDDEIADAIKAPDFDQSDAGIEAFAVALCKRHYDQIANMIERIKDALEPKPARAAKPKVIDAAAIMLDVVTLKALGKPARAGALDAIKAAKGDKYHETLTAFLDAVGVAF
jgi:hypothetical protein